MMKKLFIALFVNILLVSCSKDPDYYPVGVKTDLQEMGLHGKVKQVTHTLYVHNNGEQVFASRSVTIFNEGGKITEEDVYNSENQDVAYYKSVYKYDSQGKKVEEYHYEKGDLVKKSVFSYDLNQSREIIRDASDNIIGTNLYSYDLRGNEIELRVSDANGRLEERIASTFNASNQEIKREYFTAEDKVKKTYDYEYDSLGNVSNKIVFIKDDGASKYRYDYEFDVQQNWVSMKEYVNTANTPSYTATAQYVYY